MRSRSNPRKQSRIGVLLFLLVTTIVIEETQCWGIQSSSSSVSTSRVWTAWSKTSRPSSQARALKSSLQKSRRFATASSSGVPLSSDPSLLVRAKRRWMQSAFLFGGAPMSKSSSLTSRRMASTNTDSSDLPLQQQQQSLDPINGEHVVPEDAPTSGSGALLDDPELRSLPLNDTDILPLAPPLSYDKFLKMQDKRVVVTIRYSGESGMRPYFLTVAKKLKASHPDVMIERRILPAIEVDGSTSSGITESIFEILVDGKVVIGKNRRKRLRGTSLLDWTKRGGGPRSVYVSMQELDVAISRARRRRRPNTTYGSNSDNNGNGDE